MDISSLPPYRGLPDFEPCQHERLMDKDHYNAEQRERFIVGFFIGVLLLGILLYLLSILLPVVRIIVPPLA